MPILIILIVLAVFAVIGIVAWAILWAAKRLRRPSREEPGERKGRLGETYIASLLRQCMQQGDTLLNNVVLSNPRTHASFEIDHILLSRRGIFVIETKNRAGDIYGDDTAETWVQVLGRGDIRHEFHSPVKQCLAHAKKVASVTRCDEIYPLVVFVDGNTQNVKSEITYGPDGLRRFLRECRIVLSGRELSSALARLRDCMSHSISAEEHKRNVRKKYGE